MTETFGQYRLTKRLASGGMAEVYLAVVHGAAGFTKPVVIKRLHPRLSEDQDFVQMLIDEARITSQLTHSNICQVLDLGSVGGSYFIAMEFIAGDDLSTLQEFCRRKRVKLPDEAIIYIVAEVLAGLDFAHRKEGPDGQPLGIIHRDISPQNIIITYEGEVKVIDFGIAKARLRLVQTQAGVIKGKFRYMSPEQAMGGMIDHRTDVFAAGVVLYELLRGAPHSVALSNTEVLERIRKAEFEPLRRSRPEISPELDGIVRKALKRKKEHRFSGASEFRAVLLKYNQQSVGAFGRTELGRIMRQVFDEERRRERSGSFSGPVEVLPGSGPVTPIPLLDISMQHSSTSVMEEEQTPPYVPHGDLPAPALVADGQQPSKAATSLNGGDSTDSGLHTAYRTIPSTTGIQGAEMEFDATLSVDERAITNQRRNEAKPGGGRPGDAPEEIAPTQAFYREPSVGAAAPEVLAGEIPDPMTQVREPATTYRTAPAQRAAPGPGVPQEPRTSVRHDPQLQSDPDPSAQQDPQQPPPAPQQRPAAPRSVLYGPSIIQQPAQPAADSFQKPTNSLTFFQGQADQGATQVNQEVTEKQPASKPRPLISAGALVVLILFICGAALLGWYFKNGSLPLLSSSVPDRGAADSAPAVTAQTPDAEATAEDLTPRSRRPRSRVALQVQSEPPGARISFCGKATSRRTPTTLRVKAGKSCTLTLTQEGYVTYRKRVTPRRGGPGIQATLERSTTTHEKLMGTLRITSIQVGTVYVDGRPRGSTPLLILSLPAGTYSVHVHFRSLNLKTPQRRITLSPSRTKAVHFDPSP